MKVNVNPHGELSNMLFLVNMMVLHICGIFKEVYVNCIHGCLWVLVLLRFDSTRTFNLYYDYTCDVEGIVQCPKAEL
jgi:hypothetical protein